MKAYMITYDLNKSGQNYDALYAAIKELADGWLHPLNNIWLIVSDSNAASIRDHLTAQIDQNDQLLVMEVGPNWASKNLSPESNEWLKQHASFLAA